MASSNTGGSAGPKASFLRKTRIAVGIGTVAVLAFHATPHIFPQLNMKMFGMRPKQEVPEEHRTIFLETCHSMGIKNAEEIKLFYNSGFSALSAGSCELPNRAVVGLPRSFLLKDVEMLKKAGVKFQDTFVNWDSKCGKALEKALIPKTDHIAFAVAHELAHIKNNDFVYRSLLPTAWFYTTCKLLMFIVPRAQGAPSPGLKALLTVLLSGLSSYGYYEANKYMKCVLEMRADVQAAKCGIKYRNGGISYMKSHLRVNRVIRHLTGAAGFQRYTEKGDDLHDSYHPLITDRISKLKEIKND